MTDRPPAPNLPIPRVALLVALVLIPASAAARPRQHGPHHPRARHVVHIRPAPAVPPPVLVQGYLPRNHNIPMYNEPPRRAPTW
jgi:hypothetical protein